MSSRSPEKRSRKAIRAALEALDQSARGRPLALELSRALREADDLGPGERRAAALAARGVVRELRRVDLALSIALKQAGVSPRALIPEDRSLLRYLAWRLAIEAEDSKRTLAELKLPGPRRPRAIDDRVLASVAAALPRADALPSPEDPVAAIALRRSVPDFLARRIADEVGETRADAVLAALNQPPRLDLRANTLLATREQVAARLAEEGVETSPCAAAPNGLIAADRAHLFGRAHAEGLFELQDEGSQLIAALCGAAAGERTIDLCAGSGGKSLALAAAVGRTGKVYAADAIERRLADLPQRARRARAASIVEVVGARPPDEIVGKADAVLVDAPCSGIGSLRREVDLRWRIDAKELDAYPARQLEILKGASRYVRPGGRLVYATCSPLSAEDECVVEAFLASERGFALVPCADVLGRDVAEGPYLRVWPDWHGGGAFFGALLVRVGRRPGE